MDEAYLIGRMRASLAMARKATESAARLIHLELAGRYSLAAGSVVDGSIYRHQAFESGSSSFYNSIG